VKERVRGYGRQVEAAAPVAALLEQVSVSCVLVGAARVMQVCVQRRWWWWQVAGGEFYSWYMYLQGMVYSCSDMQQAQATWE
jgi:hypothetical protein